MSLFKRIFKIKVIEESFFKESIILLGFIILLVIIIVLGNTIQYPNWLDILFRVISLLEIIIWIPFSIARMFCISKNKKKHLFKKGEIKYKFKPMGYKCKEIIFWLESAIEPDTVYLTSVSKEHFKIEVLFATVGKMGTFIDKGYLLDDAEISLENLIELVKNDFSNCDGIIQVDAITENNNPILFQKVLLELRQILK